ncbi:enoyl-CoA hydratase [Histoplasma capsulatum G186AR]|uniref:Enoyl-CoA hydratase n=1 Tax=Ajellomyces capsulatus TaxID=5037 RepID=A0A8H7YNS1_AJECA|nr:enoyl-CoA hydratase [Histoplasma capsulatum]QSS73731.1 enoyl-CoA hydratase [Histoplasma capsulatum G186AR]
MNDDDYFDNPFYFASLVDKEKVWGDEGVGKEVGSDEEEEEPGGACLARSSLRIWEVYDVSCPLPLSSAIESLFFMHVIRGFLFIFLFAIFFFLYNDHDHFYVTFLEVFSVHLG